MPGWRRSKQIDGFRERPGEVNVPVLLDGPNLGAINFEDLKSFLDVGENCLVDARYRAAKFVRNQCRILLNNEWDDTKEPDAFADIITWDQFKDMFLSACQHPKLPHLMAILKRTMVLIAGHKAVYVRLPSEHSSEPILRFAAGGITEDWLQDKNKKYYGLYKKGIHQKYPNYDQLLEEEQAMVASFLATPEEKTYIERANTHDRWRAEAAPATPVASVAPSTPPASKTISLKEEVVSPDPKRPRTAFGVIDVEVDDNSDAAPCLSHEEPAEDVFAHGGTLNEE